MNKSFSFYLMLVCAMLNKYFKLWATFHLIFSWNKQSFLKPLSNFQHFKLSLEPPMTTSTLVKWSMTRTWFLFFALDNTIEKNPSCGLSLSEEEETWTKPSLIQSKLMQIKCILQPYGCGGNLKCHLRARRVCLNHQSRLRFGASTISSMISKSYNWFYEWI